MGSLVLRRRIKMRLSTTVLVATCVLMVRTQETQDPTGPTTYSPPSTGATEGFSNCPSVITWGSGSQKYRFIENVNSIAVTQYLPCNGDIEKCIYTAHRNYYCMDGNGPDYTPKQLNAVHDTVAYQNVSTFAGIFDLTGSTSTTNFSAGSGYDPIYSLKLFPEVYLYRLVLGGFILKTYPPNAPDHIYKAGSTDTLPWVEPTYIYLKIGEGITEAFGRYGTVIDQLTVGVTPSDSQVPPRFYTVGGFNGAGLFDATPPPHVNGVCDLVGLGGQTASDVYHPGPYIRA